MLQWVAESGFDSTDFFMDSNIVVDAFNGNINEVEFSRKQANEVALELVQVASLKASTQLFIVVPPCINNLLSNEMSLIFFVKEKNNNSMTKKWRAPINCRCITNILH